MKQIKRNRKIETKRKTMKENKQKRRKKSGPEKIHNEQKEKKLVGENIKGKYIITTCGLSSWLVRVAIMVEAASLNLSRATFLYIKPEKSGSESGRPGEGCALICQMAYERRLKR